MYKDKDLPVTEGYSATKRLAACIRRGTLLYPKECHGPITQGDAACVTGAALAGGWDAREIPQMDCPVCGANCQGDNTAVHLFEGHFWTRMRVVEWLESL